MRARDVAAVVSIAALLCAAQSEPRQVAPGAVRYERRVARNADGSTVVMHAAYVDLCAGGVALRATAPDEGRRSVRNWAQRVGATVAINGDFFDGPPTRPLGPARGNGVWWPSRDEEHYDGWIAMGPNVPPRIIDRPDAGALSHAALTDGYTEVVATQEHLVVGGAVHMSPWVVHGGRNPRAGIGTTRDGRTLVFVAIDGRNGHSAGATSLELARRMLELGVFDGARLDGGGSTTLFVRGRGVLNTPSDGVERSVANHIGVVLRADGEIPAWCAAPRS